VRHLSAIVVVVFHWCQMAEFRAAGPKNGPVKFLAALGSQRPRKRPNSKFPNLRPNFNNNWQKLAQKFVTKIFYCTFSGDLGGCRLAA
jgi:hypothetical protein